MGTPNQDAEFVRRNRRVIKWGEQRRRGSTSDFDVVTTPTGSGDKQTAAFDAAIRAIVYPDPAPSATIDSMALREIQETFVPGPRQTSSGIARDWDAGPYDVPDQDFSEPAGAMPARDFWKAVRRGAEDTVASGNPKDAVGDLKPPLHLVPAALGLYASQAMKNGAGKYGPFNWRDKPVRAHVYIAALRRHLDAWFDGEDVAEDSGVHHLGHAAAGLAILLDAIALGNLIDDRPPKGPAGRLISEMSERAA